MGVELVGTVAVLYVYPVKSTAGSSLSTAAIGARGVEGDRSWAVYTADGGLGSGKTSRRFRRIPGLLEWRSFIPEGCSVPWLESPPGDQFSADDPAGAAALSEAFGQPLSLRPETAVPHHDASPLHLLTTSSAAGAARLAGGPVDHRRFRPNLVIDTGDRAAFPEQGWEGAALRVGPEVVVRVGIGMERCAMVDQAQRGVAVAARVLKALAGGNATILGVQASVERPGQVAVGDEVVMSA